MSFRSVPESVTLNYLERHTVVALWGTPTRGQHFPTGGLRHQGLQPLPPAGYGAETSGFIAFGQLRIASPATICRICNG